MPFGISACSTTTRKIHNRLQQRKASDIFLSKCKAKYRRKISVSNDMLHKNRDKSKCEEYDFVTCYIRKHQWETLNCSVELNDKKIHPLIDS